MALCAVSVQLAVLALSGAGCSKRFYVRPDHLERARQLQPMTAEELAIPALDPSREPTYVRLESIRRIYGTDFRTGLLEVRAHDARKGLRIPGWILTPIGALMLIGGVGAASSSDDETAAVFVLSGGIFLAPGLTLLILGYVSEGAEADGPGPGMPVTLQQPAL